MGAGRVQAAARPSNITPSPPLTLLPSVPRCVCCWCWWLCAQPVGYAMGGLLVAFWFFTWWPPREWAGNLVSCPHSHCAALHSTTSPRPSLTPPFSPSFSVPVAGREAVRKGQEGRAGQEGQGGQGGALRAGEAAAVAGAVAGAVAVALASTGISPSLHPLLSSVWPLASIGRPQSEEESDCRYPGSSLCWPCTTYTPN